MDLISHWVHFNLRALLFHGALCYCCWWNSTDSTLFKLTLERASHFLPHGKNDDGKRISEGKKWVENEKNAKKGNLFQYVHKSSYSSCSFSGAIFFCGFVVAVALRRVQADMKVKKGERREGLVGIDGTFYASFNCSSYFLFYSFSFEWRTEKMLKMM